MGEQGDRERAKALAARERAVDDLKRYQQGGKVDDELLRESARHQREAEIHDQLAAVYEEEEADVSAG